MQNNVAKFGVQVGKARASFLATRRHCLELKLHTNALMATFKNELHSAGVTELISEDHSKLVVKRGTATMVVGGVKTKDAVNVRMKALIGLAEEVARGTKDLAVLLLFGTDKIESVMIFKSGPFLVYLPSSFTMTGFPGIRWG